MILFEQVADRGPEALRDLAALPYLEQLYECLVPDVVNRLTGRSRDRGSSPNTDEFRDATLDALLILLERPPSSPFQCDGHVRSWVVTTAERLYHQSRRRAHYERRVSLDRVATPADPSPGPAANAQVAEENHLLLIALNELRPEAQHVLRMSMDSVPKREIARRLMTTEDKVRRTIVEAKESIRLKLKERP